MEVLQNRNNFSFEILDDIDFKKREKQWHSSVAVLLPEAKQEKSQ